MSGPNTDPMPMLSAAENAGTTPRLFEEPVGKSFHAPP
jgi:hypothetical protein